MNNDIVIGRNTVLEALRSGRDINKILIAEGAQKGSIGQVISLAKKERIQVQYVPKKKIDSLAEGDSHQGVLAYVAAYDYADIEDIFNLASERNEDPFFLVLDEIEDPHNLGSILRTADASGAHGVIIPKRRAVGLTSAVAKSSTGAIEYIPVVRVTNIARTIEDLKGRGVWFVATDAKGDQDYTQARYDMPIGLVIGSEGKGIGRLVKEKCDFLVSLPMKGKVTSLNASVAAGLLMYEVYRQRISAGD
jgi:23S rRNA (guanosine2251-2'-O)-methyltransferase